MPKQLIVLCDGTSNSPESDIGRATNVQLLRDLLGKGLSGKRNIHGELQHGWEVDQYDLNAETRLVYYDRGLGAPKLDRSGKVLNWSWLPQSALKNFKYVFSQFRTTNEQLTARGIIDNVEQAYSFLVRNYEPGDKIYLFGFSRGAYTLRILEKVIRYIGLINKTNYTSDDALNTAIEQGFSLYNMQLHPDFNLTLQSFRKNSHSHEGIIHFLGLWDTVRGLVKEKVYSDSKISSAVEVSRHALSIDEQREVFKPEVWVANPEADSEQVWFSGVHCDIGGGYSERGLANITLQWMATEATKYGLEIDLTIFDKPEFMPNPLAKQNDSLNAKIKENLALSWEKVGGVYRRPVAQMTSSERLHESVLTRYGKTIKIDELEMVYQPSNLTHTLVAYKNVLKNYATPFTETISKLNVTESDTLSDVGEDTSLIFRGTEFKRKFSLA